jgi:murein DD-endopeptidase MepM/ murein hydrolase activator NlpD
VAESLARLSDAVTAVCSRTSISAAIVCAMLLPPAATSQNLYKYQDAKGGWVYSDRLPDNQVPFQQVPFAGSERRPEVELLERVGADGTLVLVARNDYYGTVQLAFSLSATENLAADVPTRGNRILPPRSETELVSLVRAHTDEQMSVEFSFEYIHGHPGARHMPEGPYRLPYALASSFPVSQAFPDSVTHTDSANRHAVDFVMPIGTGVYAARAGTVIDVTGEFFEAGADIAIDGPRANLVRILHADGTLALYAHLNWNSVRVVPGEHVERGQYLADSGNTGFSTGPHLHFVVQRNAGGVVESVPIEFQGGAGPMTVATGDRPTAH